MDSPEVMEISVGATVPVPDRMAGLAAAQAGWITLQPGVDEYDAPPPEALLGRLLASRGPPVPVCTWVAPQPKQKPPHPEIGILHGAGPKAAERLAEIGRAVPDTWVVLADHPRRGLVVAVPPDASHDEVLVWLLGAGEELSRIPTTGRWRVEVHS